ncbi:MAG: phage tail tape measure protein [bacterium]
MAGNNYSAKVNIKIGNVGQIQKELDSAMKNKKLVLDVDTSRTIKSVRTFLDAQGRTITNIDTINQKTGKTTKVQIQVSNELKKQQALEKEKLKNQEKYVNLLEKTKARMDSTTLSAKNKLAIEKEIARIQGMSDPKAQAQALSVVNTKMSAAGKDARGFVADMKTAIEKTVTWASAMTLLYGTLRQLQQGVQFITDLDKELTNARIVTGMAKNEADKLAVSYNNLAKTMGTTTLEVAKGSLEWLRQGKTAQESLDLVAKSTMMAKLGNMDTAQSTEYLTSMINGFKLEAQDVNTVLDKLIAVDNTAATSVSELAMAMSKTSVTAQTVGVSFDSLVSYIATVSSVTRKSASSIDLLVA